jgi:hypothetical protein
LACAQQTLSCQQALACAQQEPSIFQQALACAQQTPPIFQQALASAQQVPPIFQQALACTQQVVSIQARHAVPSNQWRMSTNISLKQMQKHFG